MTSKINPYFFYDIEGQKVLFTSCFLTLWVICVVLGFVLINVEPHEEKNVCNTLECIPEVLENHLLFGEYDLIVKVQSDDFNQLGKVVSEKIRTIPGVVDTTTLMRSGFEGKSD